MRNWSEDEITAAARTKAGLPLPGVEVVDARPRYYPRWCRPVVRVPWLREVLTWNLLLILQRTA